ncbi:DUF488 domain-containing protein [Mucilaginibacter sp. 14171R-50]|uniref:DUF488 domain-containing protein n=1 Tax=Mucilaginibacter sp. 14171R-50 TaxID=2703789 RepID=UPI00138CB59A|nr:DUF488 domain-containing protein [Mucilaginibacter sp. 14171R-50]QHS55410.1 DUF488 domain-containing protein [Mucilaginibacter sp. 14171R-50]
MATVKLKRVYGAADKQDGVRILVDRLWPRGVKKETAHLDEWMKEVAPSTELRKWFNHETPHWGEFRLRYIHELHQNQAANTLLELVRKHKTVTLLYAARNEDHNHALVLKEFIDEMLK